MAKIGLENYSVNIGNELIKKIYTVAHNLEANHIVINKAKYNRYAKVDLFLNNDCIAWNYMISI